MGRKKKKVEVREQTSPKIKCTLRKMTEYSKVLPDWNPNAKKNGRYSSSRWSSKTSKGRYPVMVYVDGDFESCFDEGLLPEEVARGCIDFLNTPPLRKKYARRAPKPLYGLLDVVRYYLFREEDGKPYFQMVVSTDQKKNKHFWGTGI